MDPVSAVGIAAASVAFLEFSLKTLVVCKQLRDTTGALPENLDIERRAKTLQRLTKDLTLPCSPSNPTDKRIRDLGLKCASLAGDLQKLLDKIKPQGEAFSNLLKSALRSVKEARTIEKLEAQILAYQKLLDTSLLSSIQQRLSNIDLENSKEFMKLQKSSQDIIKRLTCFEQMNKEELQSTCSQIATQVKDSQSILSVQITKEHVDTRAILQASANNIARKDAILESLFFPEHKARQEQVPHAYRTTFSWIFDRETKALGLWDNFANWLRSNDNMYWVHGKPGSGKSTLMSFILDERKTREALEEWADGKALSCLSFFFWRPGTPLQKSKVGMLRSLLYQLLKADEDILWQLFPLDSHVPVWTERAVLQKFLEALTLTKHKVCIFLDGLDEFEGDVQSTDLLLDLCTKCADLPHVKLCVSSRPEIHLKIVLETCKQLRLQDLTRQDMQKYVLAYLCDPSLKKIRDMIIHRAEGIFLWTSLVTNSLLRGYRSHDSEETLLSRLESYPTGLDALYTYMLNDIDQFHKGYAAAYLLMAHLSRREIKPMPALTVLTLTVTMDQTLADYSRSSISSLVTADELVSQCRATEEKVQIYCRGLLEIMDSDNLFYFNSKNANIDEAPTQIEMENSDRKRIDFTHRTAYDFIFDNIAGTRFIAGSLYSEDELEIRLVSGLLNQLLLLPENAQKKMSVLKRPIEAASSVQNQNPIRDFLLDRFHGTICSSDEKSFGGILTHMLERTSAGDSSSGFLLCCMEYSSCNLNAYVGAKIRLENHENITANPLSDATFLCGLAKLTNRFVSLFYQYRIFSRAFEVFDLLLCRLEKEIPRVLPKEMEQYRRSFRLLRTNFYAGLQLGNIDYAKAGEIKPEIENLAQIMPLVASSRAIFISAVVKFLENPGDDGSAMSPAYDAAHSLVGRLQALVPDGYAWDWVLRESVTEAVFNIGVPVESLLHQSSDSEIGRKARFEKAYERYIFSVGKIIITLSAEESMALEDLFMAQSKIQEWKPSDNRHVILPSSFAASILEICPSIQENQKAAAVLREFHMDMSKGNYMLATPWLLRMKVAKQQKIDLRLGLQDWYVSLALLALHLQTSISTPTPIEENSSN